MQTGTDSRSRQVILEERTAENVREQTAEESSSGEGLAPHGSALFGMRAALPLALWLWGLIAALVWACRA